MKVAIGIVAMSFLMCETADARFGRGGFSRMARVRSRVPSRPAVRPTPPRPAPHHEAPSQSSSNVIPWAIAAGMVGHAIGSSEAQEEKCPKRPDDEPKKEDAEKDKDKANN